MLGFLGLGFRFRVKGLRRFKVFMFYAYGF